MPIGTGNKALGPWVTGQPPWNYTTDVTPREREDNLGVQLAVSGPGGRF